MKSLAFFLLMSLLLVGCAGIGSPSQAHAMSTPFEVQNPTPVFTPLPIPPTATAVIFHLKPTSTPLPTPTPLPTRSVYAYGPDKFPADIDPLTGLKVDDPTLLERRPMAIKVTNFPRSVRPQWGLSLADHVYEYYLENEITRFIGVFYGKDASRVGPVRSGRFFDENVVRMYKAIFVFAYADDRVVDPWTESDLRNFLVIERPDNCPPLCRIGSKYNYNTLFANTQQLTQYIRDRRTSNTRQNLDGLRFEEATPFSGQNGERVSVYYSFVSYNRWEYDPASGRYLRFQEAEDAKDNLETYHPLSDSLTGERIAADNLVVLLIPHQYYIHTKTTEMVKMAFMGKGKAYAFRDGKVYPVIWERDEQASLVTLKYPDGRLYPLKPGNVWFQVIGSSSPVKQQADGTWRFEFKIP